MIHRISVKGVWLPQAELMRTVRSAVRRVLRDAKPADPCRVDIQLTDNPGIRSVNKAMRKINRVTDVLSFPNIDWAAGERPCPEPEDGRVFLGEVLISLDRAIKQAMEYKHLLDRELSYLAIHGTLHLLGYDHETEEGKAEMRRREENALQTIGLTR